jgi:putative sigma-54 modulation protein
MQIAVTGRHVEVTDALRSHAEAQVAAAVGDFPKLTNIHVILTVEKHRHTAEVVLHVPHHDQVEARAESDNMYASIDAAADKAGRQLHKLREKMTDHKAHAKLGEIEAQDVE